MMGRQTGDQASLFYEFRLEDRIPKDHLLRRINALVGPVLDSVRDQLKPYYSEIGRPSVDPELMIRVLIVGYCFGLRSERRLTQEVELHLAYRWFCRLDLDDKVPHHSTFSENRLHRFRESVGAQGFGGAYLSLYLDNPSRSPKAHPCIIGRFRPTAQSKMPRPASDQKT